MPEYVHCARAVLYMIDYDHNIMWTMGPDEQLITAELHVNPYKAQSPEPEQDHKHSPPLSRAGSILSRAGSPDAAPAPVQRKLSSIMDLFAAEEVEHTTKFERKGSSDGFGRRIGYANAVLVSGTKYKADDFAYGLPEYNELLDSADCVKVTQMLKKQKQAGGGEHVGQKKLLPEIIPGREGNMTESVVALPVKDKSGKIIAVLEVMNRYKNQEVFAPFSPSASQSLWTAHAAPCACSSPQVPFESLRFRHISCAFESLRFRHIFCAL